MGNCPIGETSCGRVCVNTSLDAQNCGACGKVCSANQMCSAGTCMCTDPITPDMCGTGPSSYCTNLKTSPKNCNACGRSCGPNQTCKNGRCGPFCTSDAQCTANDVCVNEIIFPPFVENTCSSTYCNKKGQCEARGTGYCVLNSNEDLYAPKFTCSKVHCDPFDETKNNCTATQACVYGPWNKTLFPKETEYRCSDTFCRDDEACIKRCNPDDANCMAKRCALFPQDSPETNTCISNYCDIDQECKKLGDKYNCVKNRCSDEQIPK